MGRKHITGQRKREVWPLPHDGLDSSTDPKPDLGVMNSYTQVESGNEHANNCAFTQIEVIQRRALRIIYSYTNNMPYISALYCPLFSVWQTDEKSSHASF